MYKDVARVVTNEIVHGTFYLAQRYVYKSYWFRKNGYEWEYFSIKKNDGYGKKFFEKLSEYEFEDRVFLDYNASEY